jgi:hypothetical protein
MHFPPTNYLAVLVAAIVMFVLGGLWYSPVLFMKKWVALQGRTEEQMRAEAAAANMPVLYISAFVTALLTAVVMAHLLGHFAAAPCSASSAGSASRLRRVTARQSFLASRSSCGSSTLLTTWFHSCSLGRSSGRGGRATPFSS